MPMAHFSHIEKIIFIENANLGNYTPVVSDMYLELRIKLLLRRHSKRCCYMIPSSAGPQLVALRP